MGSGDLREEPPGPCLIPGEQSRRADVQGAEDDAGATARAAGPFACSSLPHSSCFALGEPAQPNCSPEGREASTVFAHGMPEKLNPELHYVFEQLMARLAQLEHRLQRDMSERHASCSPRCRRANPAQLDGRQTPESGDTADSDLGGVPVLRKSVMEVPAALLSADCAAATSTGAESCPPTTNRMIGFTTTSHASTTSQEFGSKQRSQRLSKLESRLTLRTEDRLPISPSASQSWVSRIALHPVFDYFFASLILLNSLFIGVQTEYRAHNISQPEEVVVFNIVEKGFAFMFAVELLLRVLALRRSYFAVSTLTWNIFDIVLVLMSVVDIILDEVQAAVGTTEGSSIGKVLRMFKMARIIRIMRVLRFLAELRIMVTLIICSARSLFWLVVMLFIILYVFSIVFTQGVTDFIVRGAVDEPVRTQLLAFFGGLGSSYFTLFASITGGVNWSEAATPLARAGLHFQVLFTVYVFFCVFSVLNIVTGVFVDRAIQRSAQERDLRLEKERKNKNHYINSLRDLLEEIDAERTGFINREQLAEAFRIELVKHSFSVLGIDISDSNYLFDLLDPFDSGRVHLDEFVRGCLRLEGNAKSIDIHMLMLTVRHLVMKMERK